jgi:hypothetical protein
MLCSHVVTTPVYSTLHALVRVVVNLVCMARYRSTQPLTRTCPRPLSQSVCRWRRQAPCHSLAFRWALQAYMKGCSTRFRVLNPRQKPQTPTSSSFTYGSTTAS